MLESRAGKQLELLSLSCLLESEVSVPRPLSPQPSAAILLLSDRFKTTKSPTLPEVWFWNNVHDLFFSVVISSNNGRSAERPSQNELIDQRKVRQILSSHSRWSFGWQQMVRRAGPAEIKTLSMPLQISPGTKTKMKLGRFAM